MTIHSDSPGDLSRTREISALRALGFSRLRIIAAFLAAPVALSLVGGLISAIMGAVGGLLPALRVARIPVARALRDI